MGQSILYKISRNDFINIIKDSVEEYESFCSIRDDLIFYKGNRFDPKTC